jgi:glycerate-2-kinase
VDGGTVDRLGHREAEQALQQHDAYTYFKQVGDQSSLVMTGPTGTNVTDVCVTLIQ